MENLINIRLNFWNPNTLDNLHYSQCVRPSNFVVDNWGQDLKRLRTTDLHDSHSLSTPNCRGT